MDDSDWVKSVMEEHRNKINIQLADILKGFKSEAQSIHPSAVEMVEEVERFTLGGGKRIRPILMCMGYESIAGTFDEQIVRASCLWELVQSFLLIHDDVMDRSKLRRWNDTTYVKFQKQYAGRVREPEHFGQSMAILAGDLCSQLALLPLLQTSFSAERKIQSLALCMDIVATVSYGQVLDIWIPEAEEVHEEDILRVGQYKTARYTIEGPLLSGAILAGASQSILNAFSRYSIPLGQAFQLKDDIMGLFGTPEEIGKPVDSDLKEGKKTLLILKATERASESQAAALRRILGDPNLTEKDLEYVKEIVVSTGAREYSERRMGELVLEAKDALQNAQIRPDAKRFLLGAADYMVLRKT